MKLQAPKYPSFLIGHFGSMVSIYDPDNTIKFITVYYEFNRAASIYSDMVPIYTKCDSRKVNRPLLHHVGLVQPNKHQTLSFRQTCRIITPIHSTNRYDDILKCK